MNVIAPPAGRALHETDEHAWLARQAEALRSGRLDLLDRAALAGYLTEMTIRDRRELKSRLAVLLAHLLKIRLQPERLSASWIGTVREQQGELADLLEALPSLAAERDRLLAAVYPRALQKAADETRLPVAAFPAVSPWTADEAIRAPLPSLPPRRTFRRK